MSNFPNGFGIKGAVIRGVPIDIPHSGQIFYVNNSSVLADGGISGSNGNDGTYQRPFSTIAYAIGRCTASRGDIVYVMPGYTETIAAASGLAISKAGVSVIGLGTGSLRPTLSLSATGSTVAMSGANTTLHNFIFSSTIDDCAVAIITSAANVTVSNCRFEQSATDKNFLSCVETNASDNASDGLHVIGNERYEIDAGCLAFLSILASTDDLIFSDNRMTLGSTTTGVGYGIISANEVMLNTLITRNTLTLTASTTTFTVGLLITGGSTTSTGVVSYNHVGSLDTTTPLLDTATLDFQHFNNYYVDVIAKSARLWPVVP